MATQGRLLSYRQGLTAFEHSPAAGPSVYHSKVVLFIGGLGDGLTTVPYVAPLAAHLDSQGWGLVELLFSSSYEGWGHGSLARDGNEVAAAVDFLRTNEATRKSHIVLMGHSTGTQNLMYYASQSYEGSEHADAAARPVVDGLILQASVSDREAFVKGNGEAKWKDALACGQALLKKDNDEGSGLYSPIPATYTSLFFGAPVNSYRWVSLLDVRGDDDFFSSDLEAADHAHTFGKVKQPLLVLYSGADEYVLETVDKEQLLKRWQAATTTPSVWSPLSHVVAGATHNLANSPQASVTDLITTVGKFIESLKL